MSVTIRDVAKKAGVSVGTVSRYLNGYNLREKNRIRVEKAIKELRYKENIIAKGLKTNRSMTIGVVVRSLTNIFDTSIVTAIERVVEEENYSIIVCDYEGSLEKQQQKLRFLKDRAVDGLVLFPETGYSSVLEEFLRDNIPVVVVNEDLPNLAVDKVIVDNAEASFRAVENFIEANHTKIAIILGPEDSYVSNERFRGFIEALRFYKIPVEKRWIKSGDFSLAGGYNAARELLDDEVLPTALYVTNYYMTLGAMMAIHEKNVKVPQDLSVIGFDRFELSDVIDPALTVIEQPTREMGEKVAHLILRRIKGDYSGYPEKHQLGTRMLVRNSVRKL